MRVLVTLSVAGTVLGTLYAPRFSIESAEAAVLEDTPVAVLASNVSPAGRSLAQGAALVEGTVGTIEFSYDEVRGPRTNVEFFVEQVHEGAVPSEHLTLSIFGGFLPTGKFVTTSETPIFATGQRNLLLLTSQSAFWSPIVPGYGFVIEDVDGEATLVGDGGGALLSIGVLGPRFDGQALFQGPRFDGRTFQPSTRLETNPVRHGLGVAAAVAAIRAITKADGLTIGGKLGQVDPPWSPWSAIPVAGGDR